MAHKIYGQNVTIIVTADTPPLISFTIAGTTYQAEEGMAWKQWVASSYNTGGYFVSGTYIDDNRGRVYVDESLTSPVLSTDVIISGRNYGNSGTGGSGN